MDGIHGKSTHWGQGLLFLLPGLILTSCASKSGNEKEPNVIKMKEAIDLWKLDVTPVTTTER